MSEGGRRRPRGRPKSIDRRRVIDVATTTYWEEGWNAASLNAMCRKVGISKPGLYREFGGEDGLRAAALARYRELAVVPLLELLASEGSFADALERAVVAMTSDRGTPVGCLFTEMRMARASLGDRTAERLHAIEDERRAAFADRFARALADGEANPELSPDVAARYLDSQLTLLLLQMGAGEPAERVREEARLALRVLVAS